jgi:hypothetical protein
MSGLSVCAGHSCEHELETARINGVLGNMDANTGGDDLLVVLCCAVLGLMACGFLWWLLLLLLLVLLSCCYWYYCHSGSCTYE